MFKTVTLLFLLLFTGLLHSQTVSVKGKVTASDDFPLESATIYLTTVKDSAVVDYTISDKNGNWEIKTRKIAQAVTLKISFIGFKNYSRQLESVNETIDLRTIKLEDESKQLGEVVIVSEIPPVRIKSDTLEFNASSFKVRPDANVQTLLKQLPGVEIDNEGKITVNGKEVNQILVNGKPFFDKDGKIALQNLPAEIINKVQVTDTKTKVEELSGQKASGNNSSINLTIDEKKNKGLFGKFMGGYGTDDRFESSALLNYFKGNRKISMLASLNNINSTGFSMDEVFDNMGGGRSVYTSSNGSFGINGIRFGGNNAGITRSGMIGVNYADEWFKNFDSNVSYFYTGSNTINDNRTRQQNFLPETEDPDNPGSFINNNFTRESESSTVSDAYAHNVSTEFEIKIDSTSTLRVAPRLIHGNSVTKNTSRQSATDENNILLNESNAFTSDENDNTAFSSNIYYNKVLGNRKGRSLGIYFNNDNNKDDGANLNQSTTILYQDTDNDGITEPVTDIRNQVRYNRRTQDSYDTGFHYIEPVLDSLNLQVGLNYKLNRSIEDREGFNFDEATNNFSQLNSSLTNYLSSTTNTTTPSVSVNLEKKKFYGQISLGTAMTQFNNYSYYLDNTTRLNKNYILPYAEANVRLRFSKSSSLYSYYNYDITFPQAQQILPVEDVSNPLYTFIGNPDLDPNKTHSINIGYNNFDYATRSGFNIYGGGGINESQIVSSTIFQESAKSRTTYENVSGTYYTWFGASMHKSIKKEAHNYRYSINLSTGYDLEKGFTNGGLYEAKVLDFTPRVNFTYEYGELLTITPSYSFSYRETNYTNYSIQQTSNFVHKAALETTSYWPKHFVFGNDFNYTYNSQIADGFKKDFFLWNTSLGYNFLDDKMLFKVKVYDLLNQNLSAVRTITATSIVDEQNTVLRRYAMFSLTYKLEKFGAKNKEEKRGRSRFMW